MKRIIVYGFLIFVFSFAIGLYYSSVWKSDNDRQSNIISVEENKVTSQNIIETSQIEEKISYNANLALKKYFDECGHFTFQYSELPQELINLTKTELEELYSEWEVEEFSSNHIVLSQKIDSICDEHYLVKIGENNVEIYNVGEDGELDLYRETDIGKEYLTTEDFEKLNEGISIYGKGMLNSIIEDFE